MFLEVKKNTEQNSLPETMSKRIFPFAVHITFASCRVHFRMHHIVCDRKRVEHFLEMEKIGTKTRFWNCGRATGFKWDYFHVYKRGLWLFIVSLLLPTTIQIDTIWIKCIYHGHSFDKTWMHFRLKVIEWFSIWLDKKNVIKKMRDKDLITPSIFDHFIA